MHIAVDGVTLEGDLAIPDGGARGLVVFAHGSGSSRLSPRNREVARALNDAGLGTLLMDLLTADEEAIDRRTGGLRFDVPLLAERVAVAVDTLVEPDTPTAGLAIGLFGASTGAAAALVAAAIRAGTVRAVVSRGGRPDLAAAALSKVQAPTLLIVGGEDRQVLTLNRQAHDAMRCERRLVVIPGATHLFEEPGALAAVAALAAEWFVTHLHRPAPSRPAT